MFKAFDKMDKKAKSFLIFFLHIIFFSALAIFVYGIYTAYNSSVFDFLIMNESGIMTAEYLLLSLCECIGGALFLDYMLRKS